MKGKKRNEKTRVKRSLDFEAIKLMITTTCNNLMELNIYLTSIYNKSFTSHFRHAFKWALQIERRISNMQSTRRKEFLSFRYERLVQRDQYWYPKLFFPHQKGDCIKSIKQQ